jgi:hypothetical protein
LNDFRNTHVAHQEQALTDPLVAKKALADWIETMSSLFMNSIQCKVD